MCSQKHISKVGLVPLKKKKKDFVNEWKKWIKKNRCKTT
jgi:hypothetical protein